MKTKTSELTGPALDWAVATAEGHQSRCAWMIKEGWLQWQSYEAAWGNPIPNYSTSWSQAGPIIEREGITVEYLNSTDYLWVARIYEPVPPPYNTPQIRHDGDGPTLLIAAMRCYVASKLGDEVEVPDEVTP